ncbi:hypothetical protein ACEPAI_6996 [Sanghuangporus weigelae]
MSSLPLAGLLDLKTTGEQVNIYKVRKQVRRSPVKNINGLSCETVATLTVFIYDYLCTLEDERRLVWPSRWSLIKVVYFLNRAIAFTSSFLLVDLLLIITDGESCKRHLYPTVIMAQMTFVIGEVVLFMRVYAIWFCDRRMLALLLAVYVPGVVGATYATIHATTSAIATSLPELFGSGCVVVYQSTDFWICYLVLLFHETFMLVLILTRAFLSHGYSLSRILRMVVKDGILYYLCVLVTSLANLLVLLLATVSVLPCYLTRQASLIVQFFLKMDSEKPSDGSHPDAGRNPQHTLCTTSPTSSWCIQVLDFRGPTLRAHSCKSHSEHDARGTQFRRDSNAYLLFFYSAWIWIGVAGAELRLMIEDKGCQYDFFL